MPATRVHSPSVSTPRERHDRNHRTQKKAPNEAEVIVLSSDDESPIAGATKGHLNKSRLLSRKKKKAILRPAALVLGDVLEISDSDGAQSSSGTTACKTENGAVESLKRTVASLEQALEAANQRRAEEIAELKKAQTEEIDVLRCALRQNDFSELEEYILCEVCTHRMWKPYLLSDCGHCFCQDCLVDWFSTTQKQFIASHPDYDADHATAYNQLCGLLSGIPVLLNSRVRHQIQALLTDLRKLQPEYTCPSCRKSALTMPVEDFHLKSLVRYIAGLQGESSPRKERAHGHRGTNIGPFDAFFRPPVMTGGG